MRIINPSFEIESFNGLEMLKKLERYGRVCYKSESYITYDSARKFVKNLIDRGHESVLEHEKITVKIICDRGITHEIVRHRLASYSQESSRFCSYNKDKFGNEITVIKPFFFDRNDAARKVSTPVVNCDVNSDIFWLSYANSIDEVKSLNKFDVWYIAMLQAEWAYMKLIEMGATAQEARSVLPNSLKTEIVITANLREWRHIFKLRTAKTAHPQMQEVIVPLLREFQERVPVIFDDINEKNVKEWDGKYQP